MSNFPDPIREGLQRGWKVLGGAHGPLPDKITCDVAIVGSGAGAGITAELLTRAGLQVVIVEEGPLKSSSDFRQRESRPYPRCTRKAGAARPKTRASPSCKGVAWGLDHGELDQLLSHARAYAALLAGAFWTEPQARCAGPLF